MASYDITTSTIDVNTLVAGDILNCPYTGEYVSITLPAGGYTLECWGAQGGGSSTKSASYGGKGGYSKGSIGPLTSPITLYLYVGGKGTDDDGSYSSKTELPGGFNGGGSGRSWSGTSHNGGGGGGASDIRINSTSLHARVIVAGGGGGGSDDGVGGVGGGTSGGAGASSLTVATQTSGYSFGNGMNATYTSGECAGGGGGWYGGYGGTSENDAGSGGSGYVYTSDTASNYPNGCLLNSTYLLSGHMVTTMDGNSSFSSPDGGSETGHSGNGYIRITVGIEEAPTPIDTPLTFGNLAISKLFYGIKEIEKMYYNNILLYTGNGESGGGGTEEPEEPTSYTKMYLTCPNTYGNTATRSLDYGEYYNDVTIFESTGGYRLWYNVAKNADTGNRYMTVWFGDYDENIYYWHSTSGTSTYVDELDLPSDFGTIETVGTTSIAQKMYNSYLTFE